MLDLNLIDRDRRERLVEVALDGYGALFRVLLHNSDNFIEYVRNSDIFLDEGLLLEECSNMLHCLVSCAGISYSSVNRRIHLRHIRRGCIQPPLRCLCVCKDRHEWLVQFVSNRSCKFCDGRQPGSLCEFDTRVAKVVFRPFPIINVHRETVPLNDLALGITQRLASYMIPSELSICASIALYHVERLSSFD